MKKQTKSALMTDIHFGRRNASPQHNQDCLDFIDWFCEQVTLNECDNVIFMGDWHENRNSLNISTMNYSYQGAKKLNDLNIPVYFIIGNHDLYQRHTRDIHSVVTFSEFNNFVVIDEPTLVKNVGDSMLLVPYIFHDEYHTLSKYSKVPMWAGHFEFKGFEVTGYGVKMMSGPDPLEFKGPKNILSGHFHKRQHSRNIHYIGNPFGMDMGDAGDFDRGMAIYDHSSHKVSYVNWTNGPKYQKVLLSEMLSEEVKLLNKARVKCIVDIEINFEENVKIRQMYIDKFQLRDLKFEALENVNDLLSGEGDILEIPEKLSSIDELVTQMLSSIDSKSINNETLTEIYNKLN